MQTIALENEGIETARFFGDVEGVVKTALPAYLIEQTQSRIDKAASRINAYAQKYACDHDTVKRSLQTDATFLAKVETQNPLWEEDAMEWEYWLEEYRSWRNRLETISRR
ncbi:hypothetical protein HUU05_25465 [candidate division KSB1 bacterium]|nr:hypothetical protein [candidate division KSB1 bacterium]